MKIKLSLAVAALFVMGAANAQHGNAHSAFGVKAGVNIYTLHNEDDNSGVNSKVGFNAGFLGHIHLSKHVAFQPELVYSAQGAKVDVPLPETNPNTVKLKLGYINVPMIFQYMFDNGFRIEAGPQVGFLVNAKGEYAGVETDIKDQLKTVDFSVGAGLSYVHPASGLGIDARYNFGLTNIAEDDASKTTNRGAQIGLFYLIHKKR